MRIVLTPFIFSFCPYVQKLGHFGVRPLPEKARPCQLTACKRAVFTLASGLPPFRGPLQLFKLNLESKTTLLS